MTLRQTLRERKHRRCNIWLRFQPYICSFLFPQECVLSAVVRGLLCLCSCFPVSWHHVCVCGRFVCFVKSWVVITGIIGLVVFSLVFHLGHWNVRYEMFQKRFSASIVLCDSSWYSLCAPTFDKASLYVAGCRSQSLPCPRLLPVLISQTHIVC